MKDKCLEDIEEKVERQINITEKNITVCNDPILHEIQVGDKLYCSCDPYNKDMCLELEKELNSYGFITRVAQNIDSKVWSVAIIGRIDE